MLLLVDNGSIFTKNLVDFLTKNKVDFVAKPFEQIEYPEIAKFESFILSGRKHNNKEMNALNSKIINHAISKKKPLLGICYGAEILALTTGGTIRKMDSLQKGNSTVNITTENPLCGGTIQVYQSHNYEIAQLGKSLIQIARSVSCNYEIVKYKNSKIYGVQFHPEMTQDGLSIIERFFTL
jgi:GMP synthase (glutamine-hydrolysing)